ncbi:MAG: hypothetical protein JO127_05605 [Caulobacteraceae bacterium]|nr:hypothetical protein [Caulobacteraceae bacterium]
MDDLPDREKFMQRELVARVTTLELLVADLIHLVRQLDESAVDALAAEASRDVCREINHALPEGLEHQRFRLKQVLEGRARNLAQRRFSSKLRAQKFAPTD